MIAPGTGARIALSSNFPFTMTRWKAAGSHLALSIFLIGGIAISALLLWYPHGLYKVAGLDRILVVMLVIDLTAGPLLTLILYRPGKWGLKFDLTAVAIAQLAFLSYGLHTLWNGRPVFLVATPDTFTVVFASEVSDEDLKLAKRVEWSRRSWIGPLLVGTQMPEDRAQRRLIIDEFMAGGAGIERSPKYYMSFDEIAPAIRTSALLNSPKAPEMPIVSRRGEGKVLVDPVTALPLQIVTRAP